MTPRRLQPQTTAHVRLPAAQMRPAWRGTGTVYCLWVWHHLRARLPAHRTPAAFSKAVRGTTYLSAQDSIRGPVTLAMHRPSVQKARCIELASIALTRTTLALQGGHIITVARGQVSLPRVCRQTTTVRSAHTLGNLPSEHCRAVASLKRCTMHYSCGVAM